MTVEQCMARLQERLSLMRDLACSLQSAQAAMLASDLDRLQEQTAKQTLLCASLVALGRISPPTSSHSRASLPREMDSPFEALWHELAQVEQTVARLNRVHAALLRRGNDAIAILSRIVGSCENTYSAPPQLSKRPAQTE
jgi:hypothetical protein